MKTLTHLIFLVMMAAGSVVFAQDGTKRICVWGDGLGSTLYYTVSTPTRTVEHKHRIRLYNWWDCFRVEGKVHRVFFEFGGSLDQYSVLCDFNNVKEDGAFYLRITAPGYSGYGPSPSDITCIRQDAHDPVPRKEETVFKGTAPAPSDEKSEGKE